MSFPGDDRQAIETLLYEYADRLDRGDLPGVAALFHAATYGGRQGPQRQGTAAVRAQLEAVVRLHDDGTPRTQHVTTNVRIALEPDGATATARSTFTVLQQTASLPLQIMIAGRYEDRFARIDGQWQFASRLIDADLIGDLREHLLDPTAFRR
jgi:3-phenylpropionate/cinnamic acid dioxygenase small subunit